jgi:hypothetical protein
MGINSWILETLLNQWRHDEVKAGRDILANDRKQKRTRQIERNQTVTDSRDVGTVTRASRDQHFWTRTRILITLLIFSRNSFLCLHLVIALEIRISSFPLIYIGTSAHDTSLRQSWR